MLDGEEFNVLEVCLNLYVPNFFFSIVITCFLNMDGEKNDECAGKEGVTLSRGSVFMNRLRSDERV